RFSIGCVDNIVAKYFATVVGWYAVSRPFNDRNNAVMNKKSRTELIEELYKSGRMMLKLAEALGRLALAGREMTRLSGFTTRVDTLLNVLDDLGNGSYERTMIKDASDLDERALLPRELKPGAATLYDFGNIERSSDLPGPTYGHVEKGLYRQRS
ncbi:unnamed protein product, partial [Strongylus vulgaris]